MNVSETTYPSGNHPLFFNDASGLRLHGPILIDVRQFHAIVIRL
jgi:hypothetical protein